MLEGRDDIVNAGVTCGDDGRGWSCVVSIQVEGSVS